MTLRSPLVIKYEPLYRHAALVGTVGMALTLFGNTGLKPKNQNDWPVPKGAQSSIVLKTHIDPLKLSLRGKDTFFSASGMGPDYDWPNPRGPRGLVGDQLGFIDPTEIWLVGQDKFFNGAGRGPVYEWVNPRGAKGFIADQAPYNNNLLSISFAPFSADDWLNPYSARGLAADQLGFADASEFWLFNSVYPFSQIDWPNPRGRQSIVVDYVNPVKIWLAGQDQFFGPAGKGPSYDWPNPQGQRQRNEYGFVDPYKVSLFAAPFAQSDWPNPNRFKVNLQDFSRTVSLELIGQDQFFGPPGLGPIYDWSNPQRPRVRNEYGSVDNYKVLLSAAPPSPFYFTDWQNPRAARGLIGDQLGYTDPTEFWMLNSLYPFSQIDWANPPRSRLVSFDQPSYNVNIFSVTFAPFTKLDWPNPNRARLSITDIVGYNLNLFVTFNPFYQLDWPNPYRPRFIADTVPSYNINQFVTFNPFSQLDWPVPKIAQPSISLRTFSSFSYTTIGQDKFFGSAGLGPTYDWPNPQRPRVRNEFGYLAPLNIPINSAFLFAAPPFYQTSWPNPRGGKGLTADQLGFFDRLKVLNYNISFERVATTSFENRQVLVHFENRISTTTVENRTATAPEDKE